MKLHVSHKKKTALFVTAIVLLIGGVAFAYWTAGGSGTGTAQTGSNSPITVVQTSTVSAMGPGDSAQTLSGTFDNGNSGPVYVGTVTASIDSVELATGVSGTCDATDFTLGNATMTVDDQVPAGNGQGSWTGATIKFNNKATVNQDACKGALVHLAYVIG